MSGEDLRLTDRDWLRLRHQVFATEYEALVAAAGFQAGDQVLDAGCGAGTHLPALCRAVGPRGAVTGCDLDPANADAAQAGIDGQRYESIDVAAVTDLPYPDAAFDAVWCANVLQYLGDSDAQLALRELLRVLRPGGVIAVKDVDMLLWRLHPCDPLLIARLVAAQSTCRAVPSIRGRLLRRHLEAAGATAVQQHTLLLERWAPLTEAESVMHVRWLAELADVALATDIDECDRASWRRLADAGREDHPVHQPDFYSCEGQVLAVGRRA